MPAELYFILFLASSVVYILGYCLRR